MLRSMTGYGQAIIETPEATIRAEIKSLNSKGLDLMIRVPRAYSEKEISLRPFLSPRLERGKVSLYVELEYNGSLLASKLIDKELLMTYHKELKNIAGQLGEAEVPLLPAILNQGDLYNKNSVTETNEDEWQQIQTAIDEALAKYEKYRKTEGAALAAELKSYIHLIQKYLQTVDAQKDNRLEKLKNDLRDKLSSLINESRLDENRFEQELIFYAEKLDITEEIVRLKTHLEYFLQTMEEESAGKKLGFIAQEMGREINTIGSKANSADIQKTVVKMKEELEKIKEQVLNVI